MRAYRVVQGIGFREHLNSRCRQITYHQKRPTILRKTHMKDRRGLGTQDPLKGDGDMYRKGESNGQGHGT